MERDVYIRMAALEDRHWWFVARREILARIIESRTDLRAGARILEAGCGTGGNLGMLARFGAVSAFEPDVEARAFACSKTGCEVRAGRLSDEVPFDEGGFDVVAALDVIEHVDEDAASLRSLARRLRPDGWMLLTVPALGWLWSAHDVRHHHRRRYRRESIERIDREAGLAPVHVTYFNTLLFPLVAAVRLARNLFGIDGAADDAMPPRPLNALLRRIFEIERHLVGRVSLPVGSSLLVLARRPAA
jgi:SAM-dependent methyltransferase